MTDQQENIIFAFLQNLHIFVQINGRCANNRSFVIPSSRHPAAGSFTLLDQLRDCACTGDSARDHQCLCLPQFLEIFYTFFCKNSEFVPISEQKMSYIMLCY